MNTMKELIFYFIPQTVTTSKKNSIYLYTASREEISEAIYEKMKDVFEIHFEVVKHLLSENQDPEINKVLKTMNPILLHSLSENLAYKFYRDLKLYGKNWQFYMKKNIPEYCDKIIKIDYLTNK